MIMRCFLVLIGFVFISPYINTNDASFFSSGITRGSPKTSSRFVKIQPHTKTTAAAAPLWRAEPYAVKMLRQLTSKNSLLKISPKKLDVENCEWADFKEHWHPFLYRNHTDMFCLQDGFPLPPMPNLPALRHQNVNPYLDFDFVPKRFSLDEIKKWVSAYLGTAQKYQQGQLGLDRFFLDLLKLKVLAAVNCLAEDDKKSLDDAFPGLQSQLEDPALYSIEELADYFETIDRSFGQKPDRQFVFYPIPKGVPISLSYVNGFLDSAHIQTLPSANIMGVLRSLSQISKISKSKTSFSVKGRLFLSAKAIESLNAARISSGKRGWVDAYEAIIDSIVNTDEPNKNLEMKLECIFDEIEPKQAEGDLLSSPIEHRDAIAYEGLPTIDKKKYMTGTWLHAGAIISFLSQNTFDTDAVNIVLNDGIHKEKFNIKSRQYKFIPEVKDAAIESIKFQVLENGSIISIVFAKSLEESNASYYRFVIGNVSEFRRKNIHIGDEIKVVLPRSGLSPYIYRSLANGSEVAADYPSHCPQCNIKLAFQRKNGSTQAYCGAHLTCLDVSVEDILRFTSPQGLHIPSLTKGIVEELKQKSRAFAPSDLMSLSEGDFVAISSVHQDTFNQILAEIKAAKNTTLQKLLFALNIPEVDMFASESLAKHFGTLKRIESASLEDFKGIEGVTSITAKMVYEYFHDRATLAKLHNLLEKGVVVPEPDPEFQKLCYKKPEAYKKSDYLEIVQKINECDDSHSLSDMEYDQLCEVVQKLEAKNPNWKTKRPSVKKGALPTVDVKDQFNLAKTYSINEVEDICAKHIVGDSYVVEPKANGVACLLMYKHGKLIQGFTKRNQDSGHDITQLILQNPQTPQTLTTNFSGIIRGELYITRANLQKVNKFRSNAGEEPYVDGLSLVVGALNTRQKAKLSTASLIEFYPYDYIPNADTLNSPQINDRETLCDYFIKCGFTSHLLGSQRLFFGFKDVKSYLQAVHAREHDFGVDIDGLVIKSALDVNSRTSCAYKFDLETLKSRLTDVRFSLSSTGKLVGVALIDPLTFQNGRTVSRVHVPNIMLLDGLHKQSSVVVQYSSGSSPHFKGFKAPLKESQLTDVFSVPTQCPSCSSKLKETNNLRTCENPRCNRNNRQALLRFSRILSICNRVCSENYIKTLLESELVQEYADFFRITQEDILSKTSFNLSEANMIVASIEASLKKTSIAEFMHGLGIASIRSVETYHHLLANVPWMQMFDWSENDLVKHNMSRKKAAALIDFIQKNRKSLCFCLEKIELAHKLRTQNDETPEEVRVDIVKRIRVQNKVVEDSTLHIRRAVESLSSDLTQLLLLTEKSDKRHRDWIKIAQRELEKNKKLARYLDVHTKQFDMYDENGHFLSAEKIKSNSEEKVIIIEENAFDDKSDDDSEGLYGFEDDCCDEG